MLNHCPKLTHLSLTGVQAFLREELIVFCRDAPPEFNEHQRDVFCVFSGTGVAKLRQYLNEQKAAASPPRTDSIPASVVSEGDPMEDIDDQHPDSDGSNTPVMVVDVHGQQPQGHPTLVVPGPSAIPWSQMHSHQAGSGHIPHASTPSPLSQSAPVTSGSAWTGVPPHFQSNQSHLAGMMGAAALDETEVDGDEAFGEESEIMDQE